MMLAGFPEGHRVDRLARSHPRARFASGQASVDDWLATKALQHQDKHLSTTRVLVAPDGEIAGYNTLATGQIDFSDTQPLKRRNSRGERCRSRFWLGSA